MFVDQSTTLKTRREAIGSALGLAALATPTLALAATPAATSGTVPEDLYAACVAYGEAVDRARRLESEGAAREDRDDAIDSAELAELVMIGRFRRHGVGMAFVEGRAYFDAASGPCIPTTGTVAGGGMINLAAVRGL